MTAGACHMSKPCRIQAAFGLLQQLYFTDQACRQFCEEPFSQDYPGAGMPSAALHSRIHKPCHPGVPRPEGSVPEVQSLPGSPHSVPLRRPVDDQTNRCRLHVTFLDKTGDPSHCLNPSSRTVADENGCLHGRNASADVLHPASLSTTK